MKQTDLLDELLNIPQIYNVIGSPDGKKIVYSWKNVHENVDVFCIDLTGKNSEPYALTKTPEMTIPIRFYATSNAVIVREDKSRNERFQLFRVELSEPEVMIPLTEEDPSYFLRGGAVTPDQKYVIFGANYNFDEEKEIEPTWIHRKYLLTGEIVTIAKTTKPCYLHPELSKDGKFILYNTKEKHPRGSQYSIVNIDGEETKEILDFGAKIHVTAKFLPDNRILFLTDGKKNRLQGYNSLGIYDFQLDSLKWIIDTPERNIENFAISNYGQFAFVYEYKNAKPYPAILNLDTLKMLQLPEITGNILPFFYTFRNKWVARFYSSTQPTELIKFDLSDIRNQMFEPLTNVWSKTKLSEENLTPAQLIHWQSHDDTIIRGWLYRPKESNGKTIVRVHGGPTAHSEDRISAEIQYYASRGFTILDPNYRGSTGHGAEFKESIRKHGWGSDEQLDIKSGIQELIDRDIAQKNKVGITGTSYGGYSSWFAITKFPTSVVAASVPICGMTDLVVDYKTTRPDLRPYSEQMLGGKPEDVPDVYYERSPINFVENIEGKLLIVQGARDPNVTPANLEEVRKKLDENNIEYEEYTFEDEGHGIIKTKNQKILYKLIADFFDKAL